MSVPSGRCIHGERFPCRQCEANRKWNDAATGRRLSDEEFEATYCLNVPALPAFPIGFPVGIGYLGLYRVDQTPTNMAGRPIDLGCTVRGFRLVPEVRNDEGSGDVRVTYPKGWECLIAGPIPRAEGQFEQNWYDEGWYSEDELRAKGYVPPAKVELALAARSEAAGNHS